MKTKLCKAIVSGCLAIALAALPPSVSVAALKGPNSGAAPGAQGDAAVKNKEEAIYATLGSDGNVRAIYAINRFEVAQAGTVTDYGDYASVENLTNPGAMTQHRDSVSFTAGQGNFYYQGNMASVNLPWAFDISYWLDGAKTAPQALAGKSGDLEIRITTRPNEAIDAAFYDNYMLQITVTLDTEKCAGVAAPDATIASAGKNTVIAYTVMPKKNANIRLTASVKDFTMSGIQVSGMPLSVHMELPDTKDMTGDLAKLSDAIADLNDGVGGLTDGVKDLKAGADELKTGSTDIKSGLNSLSRNSGQLTGASSQINKALAQMSASLNGASSGDINLDDLNQLPQGLAQLAGGLEGISGGLAELKKGFSSAYAALDSAIQGIPDTAISQDQLNALYASTDPGQHALLDKLVASYTAAQTVKGTYAQVKGAFDAVRPTLDTLAGSIDTIEGTLDGMSKAMQDALSGMDMIGQLGQLASGISELAENYAAFHKGLAAYMNGVDKIAAGYSDFHNGLTTFDSGVGDLYDGVAELHDGTAELRNQTADMPDTLQTKIDDLMDEYTGSDFKPVSFISPKNANVNLVQFVLKCDGIEKAEEKAAAPEDQKDETAWDRLVALFTGKRDK